MAQGRPGGIGVRAQRQRGIQTALVLAAVVVVLRYVPLTAQLPFFTVLENLAYDWAFDHQAPLPPADVVLVAIDDLSLASPLGQFPWDRRVYVPLLEKLAGARVVAFDVLFTEPDRAGGDEVFAQALRRHGRVVLGLYRQPEKQMRSADQKLLRAYPAPGGLTVELPRVGALNLTPPVPVLASAAAGLGAVDLEPDADGVYRRAAPLRQGFEGGLYPHFALEIARLAAGQSPETTVQQAATGVLTLGGPPVPLGADGQVLINYAGPPGTVPTYSFAAVLSGQVPAETFRDKLVLVGATAAGLYDMRPAPFRHVARKFYGVETNASLVRTLRDGPVLIDATRSPWWLGLALALGGLAGFLVWSGGENTGPLLGLLILLLVALPSFFVAFFLLGQVLPYGAVVWACLLPVAVGAAERVGAERRMVKRQFGVYVSPGVLQELVRHPDLVRQGQRREVTVLFSDVRGSTALGESLSPEVWLAQLNEYLTAMSAAILEGDGYLDKFMGDGIMVVWNAFGTQPDHAERAVACARLMVALLAQVNREWEQAPDRTPLRIGIGVHSGEAVVGNVGSERRSQFTAIGDMVNTASRVESLNKEWGTQVLISEATAALLADRSRLGERGEAAVRGRTGAVRLFELVEFAGPEGEQLGVSETAPSDSAGR